MRNLLGSDGNAVKGLLIIINWLIALTSPNHKDVTT